jgi:hypothetical protein
MPALLVLTGINWVFSTQNGTSFILTQSVTVMDMEYLEESSFMSNK